VDCKGGFVCTVGRAESTRNAVWSGRTDSPDDSQIPAELAPLLSRIGPATLVSGGGLVSVMWDSIERDRERLLAGASAVSLGARPDHGIYR